MPNLQQALATSIPPDAVFKRSNGRNPHDLRQVKITRNYTKHAEGSVLVEFGDTKVLCTASVVCLVF